MPPSHAIITVSHQPSSTSFFASALQPLGYRYHSQTKGLISFAASSEPDVFLSESSTTPGFPRCHITFLAPSSTAVDRFHHATLLAGGTSQRRPNHSSSSSSYSAIVSDLDGNTLEVLIMDAPTDRSRVLHWQQDVARSTAPSTTHQPPPQTHISRNSHHLTPLPTQQIHQTPAIYITQPPAPPPPQIYTIPSQNPQASSRALLGTLLGAAAGATFAYAMTKAETLDATPQTSPSRIPAQQARGIQALPIPSVNSITSFLERVHIPDSAPPAPAAAYSPSHHQVQLLEAPPPASSHHSRSSTSRRSARDIPLPSPAQTTYTAAPSTVIPRSTHGRDYGSYHAPRSSYSASNTSKRTVRMIEDRHRPVEGSVAPSESVSQISEGGRRHRRRRSGEGKRRSVAGGMEVVEPYEVEEPESTVSGGRSRASRRSGTARW